jgi:hypothetical protein
MSVVVRTNRATNPNATTGITGWAAIAGTSGVAGIAHNTGMGYQRTGFARVTWTTGTSALSGGLSYSQTSGLSASTAYALQIWVRASKNQTMRAQAVFKNSGGTTVNTVNGSATSVAANVWTPLKVTGTSGALVTQVTLEGVVTTGGSTWSVGNTLDGGAVLIETGSTFNNYYDGETPDAQGVIYAWTGAVDASTSTATVYTPVLTLTGHNTMAPCPRVVIAITDLDPGVNEVKVWRTSDGRRRTVRGTRAWKISGGSDTVTDYEVPFGVSVTYQLEVSEGVSAKVETGTSSVTVTPAHGVIQDPMDPQSAVALYTDVGPNGEPALTDTALANYDYEAEVSTIKIMGSSEPVAFIGQRMSTPSNVPFNMYTDTTAQGNALRNILLQAAPVLIRPLPNISNGLPGLCYLSVKTVQSKNTDQTFGGQTTEWTLVGDLVAAPTVNIVVVLISYGTVQALWSTYQSAQTALASKTYLQTKTSPSGA